MASIAQATHALVDGVRYNDALRRLYSREDVEDIEPLYLGTRWHELAEHGPILVKLKGSGLLKEAQLDLGSELYRALTFISSSAATRYISKHLSRFITFNGPFGNEQLLRFADPLVAQHWLASYANGLPDFLMGPIETWWVAHWSPSWVDEFTCRWQPFQASVHLPAPEHQRAPDFLAMSDNQYAALQAASQWQLKERLVAHIKKQASSLWEQLAATNPDQWLDECLAKASGWGVNTERQIAIWVDLSLRLGKDFSTASGGLYQRWRAEDLEGARLSRQDQLYALDRWSRTGAITESVSVADGRQSAFINEGTHD